jgi:DNA ligase-1
MSSTTVPIEVCDGGIYLPEAEFWLDPSSKKRLAFVSHAHGDHFAPHEETICSRATGALVRERFRKAGVYREQDYGDVFEIAGYEVELFPAGHTLGSAQILVKRRTDGASLIYTGDFKTRHGLTAEPTEVRHADTLIMETTFGLPKYEFPSLEEVRSRVLEFCQDARAARAVPVLLGYSFGKAQEIMAMLNGTDYQLVIYPTVKKLMGVYENFGFDFPPYEVFEHGMELSEKVLVMPPMPRKHNPLAGANNVRRAMFSGWGIDPNAKYRYGVDDVFPLSDHAGYSDLVAFVEQVAPWQVLTTHGYAAEFARDLRRLGIEAWSLEGIDQLELDLD